MSTAATTTSGLVRPPSLWRHHDFRLLWIGETTSKFGSRISTVALPLTALTVLHASILHIGLLTAAVWLPWLLIGLPAGAWVDRLPRKQVMLVANVTSMVLMISVPVAAWAGLLTIWYLLLVALLTGAASVFFETAFQVYLPALIPRDRLAEGNARLQASSSAADVAGPGAAGFIAHAIGAVNGLLADAASFLVATVCLARIRTVEKHRRPPRDRRLLHEIAEGLGFVARDRYLRVLTVSGAYSNLTLTGYQAILLVFLVREVGLSAGAVGAVLMAMSVGGLLGAAVASRIARRFGTARGVLLCQFFSLPSALLIPLTGQGFRLAFVVIAGIVIGAGVVSGNVIRSSWRQGYPPEHLRGRVTVSVQFLNFGTIPVAALISGALGTALGIRPTLWLMTAAVALAPLILLWGPIRTDRDLPATPG